MPETTETKDAAAEGAEQATTTRRRRSAKPAEAEPAPRTLHQRLVEVALLVDRIEKGGHNDRQDYDFVQAADVFERLRTALFERSILVLPGAHEYDLTTWTTGRGATSILTTIKLVYRFIDADDPTVREEVPWIAQGVDTGGDKGVWKAYTGGLKYVLLQTFLVPMGDDPENDRHTLDPQAGQGAQQPQGARTGPARVPRERAERIVASARDAGLTQTVFEAKLAELGFERVVDLSVDAAEALEAFIQAEAGKGAEAGAEGAS